MFEVRVVGQAEALEACAVGLFCVTTVIANQRGSLVCMREAI